jgi:hypothetical protein
MNNGLKHKSNGIGNMNPGAKPKPTQTTQLLMVDGGSAYLDLTKLTCGHLHRPEYYSGRRRHVIWLFEDDLAKSQRRVLVINHHTTMAGGLPRNEERELKLTTIYGYNAEKRQWGPEEHRSCLQITPADAKRIYEEAKAAIESRLVEYKGGPHWYLPNHIRAVA